MFGISSLVVWDDLAGMIGSEVANCLLLSVVESWTYGQTFFIQLSRAATGET